MSMEVVPIRRNMYAMGRRGGRRGRGQRGGFSVAGLMKGLSTADSIARSVKPFSALGNILDSTGASKGKIGRVFRGIASAGSSLGYGRRGGSKTGGRRRRRRRR